MDLKFSTSEIALRDNLRRFFNERIPLSIREKVSSGQALEKDEVVRSQRVLNANGLAVPHWPQAWGGRGWSPIELYIFSEELQRAAVPLPLQFNCHMVGPVIAAFGSRDQKERFLPRAANLDDWWCQGFSEPGAGSDLASLTTRATRVDNGYIVTGQKTWTTYAQHADWMFLLARTDPNVKKQAGISFLLVDMKSPGVTVRPIMTIDGRHEVNDVFLDDVHVPRENLVGEENAGWSYAKFLLANERTGIARIGVSKERIAKVKRLAKLAPAGAGTMWEVPTFRARVLALEAELKALELTSLRVLSGRRELTNGKADPVPSVLKLKGSEIQQAAATLLMEIAGPMAFHAPVSAEGAVDPDGFAAPNYLNNRKVSIYGGSNEIQRNIIAQSLLS